MIKVVNAKPERYIQWKSGAILRKGQIAVLSGATVIACAAAPAAATLVGLVLEDCASGATAILYPLVGTELEIDIYQAGSVDDATDAMRGVAYDIIVDGAAGDGGAEGEMYLDLSDTTGPFLRLMSYNNAAHKAYVRCDLADCIIA